MPQNLAARAAEDLVSQGVVTSADKSKVEMAINTRLPAKAYNQAVLFLGLATLALAVGSMVLAGIAVAVPEALWSALGAGIGGLAGIFMGKD